MANAFEAYQRAKQGAMQQGQQQFGMEQAIQKLQRDRQMKDIMAGALKPAMPQVPAMGPTQGAPLSDYPAQEQRFDTSGAIQQLMAKGMIPEAMQLQSTLPKGATGGGIGTYNPRDYTTKSWTDFIKSKDPTGLVRYETSLQERLAGDPDLAGRVTTTQSDIAGGKEGAKIEQQTIGAQDLEFSKRLGAEGGKIYTNLQKAAQKASTFIPRLQSLKELASKVRTGTGAEIQMVASRALGIDSANMEVLNAKLGELAQDILNQQTGTKTDFDFENAVRQSAALGKTPEANALLIEALINRQEQAVNFGNQARDAYASKGVKGVLDMRYQSAPQYKKGGIVTGPDGKRYIIKTLKADGTPDDVMLAK